MRISQALLVVMVLPWVKGQYSTACDDKKPNDGWIKGGNGYCYTLTDSQLSFDAAEINCNSKGGYLASVQSLTENYYLMAGTRSVGFQIWIGGIIEADGTRRWTDKTDFNFNKFSAGLPPLNRKTCANFLPYSGIWLQEVCSTQYYGICKKSISNWEVGPNQRNFYLIRKEAAKFHEQETYCKSKDAHLATIHNSVENDFIRSYARSENIPQIWIGLFTNFDKWNDGSIVDYTNWPPGFPRAGHYTAANLIAKEEGQWQNLYAENKFPGVCQKKIGTDYDRACDLQDPNNGWVLGPDNLNCYMITGSRYRFDDAETHCQSKGGQLTSILSRAENDFIKSFVAHNKKTRVWIGLKSPRGLNFGWVDKKPFVYKNWNTNPYNRNYITVAYLKSTTGKWFNIPKNNRNYGVCKKSGQFAAGGFGQGFGG